MTDKKTADEKRIDADDGLTYTFQQLSKYYKGTYSKAAIKTYWDNCKPLEVPKPKAKAAKPPKVIKVGAKFPKVELDQNFPPEKVNLVERFKGKKVPEYLARAEDLKAKGVDEVIVYCVNDAAVMTGWEKALGTKDTFVTMLADPQSKLTRRVGMVLKNKNVMGELGNPRCKRFVLIVDDGEIKAVTVSEAEDDPAGDNDPEGPVTAKTRVDHILTLL